MAKRAFFFLLFLIIIISGGLAEENLIKNGSFEELSGDLPSMWATDLWDTNSGSTNFYVEKTGAFSGNQYITIENLLPNDAKLIQHVSVKPNTVYKLACRVKASEIGTASLGANIGVLQIGDTSTDFKETNGEWRQVELFGKTGPQQTQLAILARLGGYSNLNTGKASFDEYSLVEVPQMPQGVRVVNFFLEKDKTAFQFLNLEKTGASVIPILFLSLFFIGFFMLIHVFFLKKSSRLQQLTEKIDSSYINLGFLLFACLAFLLRIYLAFLIPGYTPDINLLKEAASGAKDVSFPFGPGYLIILNFTRSLQQLLAFDLNSVDFQVLLKLPPILADMLTASLLYFFLQKTISPLVAAGLGLLYLFNPAILHNASAFGQIDSFLALSVFLTVYFIYKRKLALAAGFFSFTGLIKPLYFLLLAPLIIFALVDLLLKKEYRKVALSGLSMVTVFVLINLPYVADGFFLRLLEDSSRFYATDNAFNLYALFGLNGTNHSQVLLFPYYMWGGIFFFLILGTAVFFIFWYKRQNAKTPDEKTQSWPFLLTAFIITSLFMLGTGIHERFITPALILLLAGYAYTQDRRLLWLYVGFSITLFFNQAIVLDIMQKHNQALVPNNDIFMKLLSLTNIVLFIYTMKSFVAIYLKKQVVTVDLPLFHNQMMPVKAGFTENFPGISRDKLLLNEKDAERGSKLKWSRLDLILVGALTLAYGIIALYNLGSLKAPQTFWKPANRGESFSVDLGARYDIGRISYFFGLGQGSYRLEFSDDGQNWKQPQVITQRTQFDMMEWRFLTPFLAARYVLITCESPSVMLKEIGFYKPDSQELLPVKQITPINIGDLKGSGKPEHVFDEPKTVAYNPFFLNGMYFDEVYHARTGYEHYLLLPPTETTHPPLGKVIISIGIALFGMTPFGWRIMGTLLGIAMVPIMYAFGKRIFLKTEFAFMTAFLMAFDFMHFTQTRIATIDVYGVFFIILMYYFMYQYMHMNFFKDNFKKTLSVLFFSGLFAGLGIASKWIALWGGAGLAVLFFISLFSRYIEYRMARWKLGGEKGLLVTFILWNTAICRRIAGLFTAKKQISEATQSETESQEDQKELEVKVRVFFPRMWATLGWCLLVFILLPVIIMELSYLPIMIANDFRFGVLEVFRDQMSMFSYHAGITQTHPFMSQWYEWPLLIKPIWYYSGQGYLPADKVGNIAAFGNPAIWWLGIIAIPAALVLSIVKRQKWMLIIILIAASQYMPWIVIPRKIVFIYHFFATVPFLIMCIVYCIKVLQEKFTWFKYVNYAYLVLVLLLFVMFYPILSGFIVDKSYVADFLRWFGSWTFYS